MVTANLVSVRLRSSPTSDSLLFQLIEPVESVSFAKMRQNQNNPLNPSPTPYALITDLLAMLRRWGTKASLESIGVSTVCDKLEPTQV
jgi:hypothetical protein